MSNDIEPTGVWVNVPPCATHPRPFSELRESGLLWLINATALHPRGVALALVMDEAGAVIGWELLGAGADEPWQFMPGPEIDDRFRAVEETIRDARHTDQAKEGR